MPTEIKLLLKGIRNSVFIKNRNPSTVKHLKVRVSSSIKYVNERTFEVLVIQLYTVISFYKR